MFLVSCDNDDQFESNTAKVELNTVNLFLKDTYSLLSDTNKNPIVSFSNLADDFSSKTISLNKNNIVSALVEAKKYSHGVIVVENHTIVKLISFDDCQLLKKIGNWEIELTPEDNLIEETNSPDWYGYKRIDKF